MKCWRCDVEESSLACKCAAVERAAQEFVIHHSPLVILTQQAQLPSASAQKAVTHTMSISLLPSAPRSFLLWVLTRVSIVVIDSATFNSCPKPPIEGQTHERFPVSKLRTSRPGSTLSIDIYLVFALHTRGRDPARLRRRR